MPPCRQSSSTSRHGDIWATEPSPAQEWLAPKNTVVLVGLDITGKPGTDWVAAAE